MRIFLAKTILSAGIISLFSTVLFNTTVLTMYFNLFCSFIILCFYYKKVSITIKKQLLMFLILLIVHAVIAYINIDNFLIYFFNYIYKSFIQPVTQNAQFRLNFFLICVVSYGLSIISTALCLMYLNPYSVFCIMMCHLLMLFVFLTYNFVFFMYQTELVIIEFGKLIIFMSSTEVQFSAVLDATSYSFVYLTVSIALFANCYILIYFKGEPFILRLLILINFFVCSMLVLLLAGNFAIFFLGWELIGYSSFLLISFWMTRMGSLKAGLKAFSFNKGSDAFLLAAIVIIYCYFNSGEFNQVLTSSYLLERYEILGAVQVSVIELLAVMLLTPAVVKSAQFGAHIWLPDSMEAPAPASALIHSATLVSAGIYIIIRFYPILEMSLIFSAVAPLLGSVTALVGGVSAVAQNDIKKILAYSTISHCGFMFFLASAGYFDLVILYLYIHGIFKAGAFFSAGNIIAFSKNYQDIRKMGYYIKYLPVDFFFLTICLTALAGSPYFLGFLLKHKLLITASQWPFIVEAFLFTAAPCGLLYSYKILYYVFFDERRGDFSIYNYPLSDNARRSLYLTFYNWLMPIFLSLYLVMALFIVFNVYIWYTNYSELIMSSMHTNTKVLTPQIFIVNPAWLIYIFYNSIVFVIFVLLNSLQWRNRDLHVIGLLFFFFILMLGV